MYKYLKRRLPSFTSMPTLFSIKKLHIKYIFVFLFPLITFLSSCDFVAKEVILFKNSTAEESINKASVAVKADYAHQQGITGKGTVIGIIDTGANVKLKDLNTNINSLSRSMTTDTSDVTDIVGHGTSVASVIAAARDAQGLRGVAYNTSLMIIKADDQKGELFDSGVASGIDYATRNGADIISLSVVSEKQASSRFVSLMQKAVDKGVLMVVAAGNYQGSAPVYPGKYAGTFKGDGQVLAVGAVDDNKEIAYFSNRAGSSKEYFLTAPGVNIEVLDQRGNIIKKNGTSFAAPIVASAAAMVKQHSPHLTGREVASILLESADDLGEKGVDDVYGHGFLNVKSALMPLGENSIVSGDHVDSRELTTASYMSNTSLALEPSFSTAFLDSSLLKKVMTLDRYGRSFTTDLNQVIERETNGINMPDWVRTTPLVGSQPLHGRISLNRDAVLTVRPLPPKWRTSKSTGEETGFSRTVMSSVGSLQFKAQLDESKRLQAGVGLPLSASMGLAFEDEQAVSAMRVITARHAMENPFLSFSSSGLNLAYAHNVTEKLRYNLGLGMKSVDDFEAASNKYPAARYRARSRRSSGQRVGAMEVSYTFTPKLQFGFNAGYLLEDKSILNTFGSGAFDLTGEARTNFAGISGTYSFSEKLKLYVNYQRGFTDLKRQETGLIREISDVESDSFSLALVASNTPIGRWLGHRKDSLVLSVSQPLRIGSGHALLNAPVGRDIEGNVKRDTEILSLSPSGRQIDFELNYSMDLSGNSFSQKYVALMMGITREANHVRNADLEARFGVKFHSNF